MAAVPRGRIIQEQRRAETRERLLDATVQCLIKHGYARTTSALVAQFAGYTRGAELHHFGCKEELVVSAVEHLYKRRMAEFAEAFSKLPPGVDEHEAANKMTWELHKTPLFLALLEVIVASRTDERLRRKLLELGKVFNRELERIRLRFSRAPKAAYELFREFAGSLMAGRVVLTIPSDAANPPRASVSDDAILGLLNEFTRFLLANPKVLSRYAR